MQNIQKGGLSADKQASKIVPSWSPDHPVYFPFTRVAEKFHVHCLLLKKFQYPTSDRN